MRCRAAGRSAGSLTVQRHAELVLALNLASFIRLVLVNGLLKSDGMSMQPAVYDAFPDIDEPDVKHEEPDGDVSNPVPGILLGVVMCLPFWAVAVYLLLRSI